MLYETGTIREAQNNGFIFTNKYENDYFSAQNNGFLFTNKYENDYFFVFVYENETVILCFSLFSVSYNI